MHLVIACCHEAIEGTISPKNSKLLIFASRFHRKINSPKTFILTGGITSPESRKSESESAYEWLKNNNHLPEGDILLEQQALDSFENLKNSVRLVSNYDKVTVISFPWKKERFNIMANALHIQNFHFRSPAIKPSDADLSSEEEEVQNVKKDPLCEGKYFQRIREKHNFNS